MSKKGMLLVGHGSKLPFNKELVEETGNLIRTIDGEFIIRCGFMSMNRPSVGEQLAEFRKDDIDMLVVVPLFLAKGVHILEDIPELLGLPKGQRRGSFDLDHRTVPLVYADPIGRDPLLAELMLKNAYKAIDETA